MKKNAFMLILFIITGIGIGDQYATTDNYLRVILKDDGLWNLVDDDWLERIIEPFAYTDDSQRVFLAADSNRIWYYANNIDSLLAVLYPGHFYTQESIPYHEWKKPQQVYEPKLVYPESARKAGIEGQAVVLMLTEV